MPLLIVLITLLVESNKPTDVDDTSYPNVGIWRCFLGHKRIEPPPNYLTTSHFLYFQLEVLILLIANVILIGLSFLHIHEPFRQRIKLLKAQEKNVSEAQKKINLEEFKMCLYFFVITGTEMF